MKHAAVKLGRFLMVLAFWLLIWGLSAKLIDLPFLLPSPQDTFVKLIDLWGKDEFWMSLLGSFLRVTLGFSLAVLIGSFLAVLCSGCRAADILLSPVRSLIRSTPVSSFVILVLLWMTVDITPLFISFLAVMPIIWQDMQQGIAQTSAELIEMARSYGFSKFNRLFHVYLPSVSPYFSAACASGIGMAWKACVAAEVIARPLHSVGRNLQDAKVYLLTDELFAWTVTVVMLSMSLEGAIKMLLRHGKKPLRGHE